MKFRSKTPPEAIPFQRGKPKPAGARPLEMDWISTSVWTALEKEGNRCSPSRLRLGDVAGTVWR